MCKKDSAILPAVKVNCDAIYPIARDGVYRIDDKRFVIFSASEPLCRLPICPVFRVNHKNHDLCVGEPTDGRVVWVGWSHGQLCVSIDWCHVHNLDYFKTYYHLVPDFVYQVCVMGGVKFYLPHTLTCFWLEEKPLFSDKNYVQFSECVCTNDNLETFHLWNLEM